jgi:hypothetical protein
MCSRCIEIDERIDHLKKLGDRLLDPKTLRGIELLVAHLVARKAALHPEDCPPQQ